jgi:hypothetical protein
MNLVKCRNLVLVLGMTFSLQSCGKNNTTVTAASVDSVECSQDYIETRTELVYQMKKMNSRIKRYEDFNMMDAIENRVKNSYAEASSFLKDNTNAQCMGSKRVCKPDFQGVRNCLTQWSMYSEKSTVLSNEPVIEYLAFVTEIINKYYPED